MKRKIHWFLVYAENKMGGIKELTEKEHGKLIGSKHTIGWIDQTDICFSNSEGVAFLRLSQLQQILNLISVDEVNGGKK